MVGYRYAPFCSTSRFFVSVINPGHGDVDERVEEGGGTINVRRGITERGGRDGVARMDSRTNGALLLLLRRLVAGRTRPVEILRFVVARKNPEDWLKEGG